MDILTVSNEKPPEEFFYSANHLWIAVDENVLTLGITHVIPEELGEILYFDGPEVGDRISEGDSLGFLESVTGWCNLISPVDALVIEMNLEILDQPFLINDDPYEGWILKAEIESENKLIELMKAPEYKKHIKRL